MAKKRKMSKKLLVFLLIAVVLVGAVVAALISRSRSNNAAYVAPASELNNSWALEEESTEGLISDAAAQNVYLDSASEIEQVCVTEGQSVAKGDVLLTYDIDTLNSEVEVAQLTINAKNDQLALAQKKLENDQNLPVRSTEETTALEAQIQAMDDRMQELEAALEQARMEADLLAEEAGDSVAETGDGEDGSEEADADPADENASEDSTAAFRENAKMRLQELEQNISDYEAELAYLGSEMEKLTSDTTVYYTQSEKDSLIADQQLEIRRIQNSIRSTELDITNLQQQIADAKVVAAMDGVVSYISKETQIKDGSPYMTIVALSGLSVIASVDEYNLDSVQVGDQVMVTSWESGSQTMATIMEISQYPTDRFGSYYYGNNNFSSYEYLAYMDETAGFYADEWVSVRKYSEDDALVLESVYVRSDDDGDYVLMDDGSGKLKRQYIETRPATESGYVVIVDGISEDDLIAFPYGKSAFEGNVTTTEQPFSLF